MNRRVFLALSVAGLAGAGRAQSVTPSPADLAGVSAGPFFADWFNGFYAKALVAGLPRGVLERELSGLSPDPHVLALDARQPEFAQPVSNYIRNTISPERVAVGQAKRGEIAAFGEIERAYGVPREVLIGVWAIESGFGIHQGDMDVVRSLASLALGRRRVWAEDQLLAALHILANADVSRAQLKGSWAGAMGQTQILPSAYLESAVSASGAARPDIWGSSADALATAANLLVKYGWRRGEGWTAEVILPAGFDYGLTEGPSRGFAWWAAKDVRLAPGVAWSEADAAADSQLLLPCGMSGPAFLALPNHFAIRGYNNSIAYALAVGLLADRFAGGRGVATSWPSEVPLSLDQRMAAQGALTKLGFYPGVADGMIGFGTRKALRVWQKTQGLPADGYLTAEVVARLISAAAKS